MNAQVPNVPALPHSSPFIYFPANATMTDQTPPSSSHDAIQTPTSTSVAGTTRRNGLRQAAFWVAYRQEIYAAFLKQRPFAFSLEGCDSFRTSEPAEDAVWADRLIIFCADVLQYCHGSKDPTSTGSNDNPIDSARQSKDRWSELKAAEKHWSEALPTSFDPIYYRDPDPSAHEFFPEMWYLADCHVAGVQHAELARILLAVYDPHIPKLGPGHVRALAQLSETLRTIVRRLCGIALSNRKTPPGLVTACMGIAMCGEHFTERREQEALLAVLAEMESEHAWPESRVEEGLRAAWGW